MTRETLNRLVAAVLLVTLLVGIAATAFAYETIPYGEVSDRVRKLQKALKSKGCYSGSVDGKFGPATKTAVRKFQRKVGLYADGKPGHRTLTALYDGVTKINNIDGAKLDALKITDPASIYYGCTGARVQQLQRALKAVNCFFGPNDGVFGEMTLNAVRKYQKARGLHVDGIAGRQTLASLNRNQKRTKLSTSFLLAKGSRGREVASLQSMLAKDYTITDVRGVFGDSTRDAVKNWQQTNGLNVTGTVSQSQYNRYIVK